jgi:hypothetical protein
MCYRIINYILELYIYFKLFICNCSKKKNFEILSLYLIGDKNYKIKNIITDWDIIKELSKSINYIDIEYYYDDKIYKICYKYPNSIIFPINLANDIPFYQQISEIKTNNNKLNNILLKYIQPNRYINFMNITIEDICKINKIEYHDEVIIYDNFFKEKILSIHDKLLL